MGGAKCPLERFHAVPLHVQTFRPAACLHNMGSTLEVQNLAERAGEEEAACLHNMGFTLQLVLGFSFLTVLLVLPY